jgi:hypothetical protein
MIDNGFKNISKNIGEEIFVVKVRNRWKDRWRIDDEK